MLRQPALIKTGDSWTFVQPDNTVSFYKELLTAMELMDSRMIVAERMLRKIIMVCGTGSIDALLTLGLILNRSGRSIEGDALIHRAHSICLEAIPPCFDTNLDEVYWCIIENRPFLRSFHAVCAAYIREQQYDKALEKINYLLRINKGDDTDVSAMLPACYLHLQQYEAYMDWYNALPAGKRTMETAFCSFLACFKLGRKELARTKFLEARREYPHMAAELIKSHHRFPEDEFETMQAEIPAGSRQEAFVYWYKSKELWQAETALKQFMMSIDSHILRP
ncbi:hypothetical protein [Chitinophaga solisilvae]|uniref:Uncharacterized protein n=1 Tax=Chitinophaga solisilvae TaxID=1233460 RepID=A0A3S1D0G5_9BACT|nr:hypothetical protein [Chitinophaga solisilvae]NSL87752.1 hypothetical protein [Chitinophaga solisilvae]